MISNKTLEERIYELLGVKYFKKFVMFTNSIIRKITGMGTPRDGRFDNYNLPKLFKRPRKI